MDSATRFDERAVLSAGCAGQRLATLARTDTQWNFVRDQLDGAMARRSYRPHGLAQRLDVSSCRQQWQGWRRRSKQSFEPLLLRPMGVSASMSARSCFVAGELIRGGKSITVHNPFNGSVVAA